MAAAGLDAVEAGGLELAAETRKHFRCTAREARGHAGEGAAASNV